MWGTSGNAKNTSCSASDMGYLKSTFEGLSSSLILWYCVAFTLARFSPAELNPGVFTPLVLFVWVGGNALNKPWCAPSFQTSLRSAWKEGVWSVPGQLWNSSFKVIKVTPLTLLIEKGVYDLLHMVCIHHNVVMIAIICLYLLCDHLRLKIIVNCGLSCTSAHLAMT